MSGPNPQGRIPKVGQPGRGTGRADIAEDAVRDATGETEIRGLFGARVRAIHRRPVCAGRSRSGRDYDEYDKTELVDAGGRRAGHGWSAWSRSSRPFPSSCPFRCW